ncbi:hypothetical protein [Leptospira wolffii]|uniref:hypothetical protein n=1 Tax=Leptospira wolffii TaxID=409998 RepID=UPI00058AE2EF|nr:hypothetical protein [Leptospira wolffii]
MQSLATAPARIGERLHSEKLSMFLEPNPHASELQKIKKQNPAEFRLTTKVFRRFALARVCPANEVTMQNVPQAKRESRSDLEA